MRDDMWVAKHTSELITNRLTRGLLMLEEFEELEEREKHIKELFINRFGKKRAKQLWKAIQIEQDKV